MHDELAADDAVGLGVAAALEAAGLPEPAHLLVEARDDRVDVAPLRPGAAFPRRVFRWSFGPFAVDQRGDEPRERVAKQGVERGADERIEAAVQVHQGARCVASQFCKAEPVLAGGMGRSGFTSRLQELDERRASERLQELDQRAWRRPGQVAWCRSRWPRLTTKSGHLLISSSGSTRFAERLARLIVGGVRRQLPRSLRALQSSFPAFGSYARRRPGRCPQRAD